MVKFNPFTGSLDFVESSGTVPGTYNLDTIELQAGDITNGFVTLSGTPTTAIKTFLLIKGAPNLYYGDDFIVSGNTLDWNGLELDGLLEAGDKLTVIFD